MNLSLELSDENAARLKRQAAAHGLSLEAWVQALALEKAHAEESEANRSRSQAAPLAFLKSKSELSLIPKAGQSKITSTVAVRHDLTVYDAAYLDAAIRERSQLASLDAARCKAAVKAGIALFEIPQ